jgi:type I restriction enzyme S subunit
MGDSWSRASLRDAGVVLIDCDHATPPAAEVGYPYVAIPQLRDGHIDFSSARRISQEHLIQWTRKAKPQAHDVVLSRRTNPGVTAYVSGDVEFALGQNLVLLRADGSKVFPPFLRWLVRGPEWWRQIEKFINVGAVFDSLKCADVPNFELLIPPLPEQRAIAHVLDVLDGKIELNRRMAETLEAMARVMFKSWFVDFDPVRAKAESRPTGLPDDLAALFPSTFEDEGYPSGWELRRLSSIATFLNGLALQKFAADADEPSLPVIKIAELRTGPTPRSGRAKTSLPRDYIIGDGDHIFSWSGTLIHSRWSHGSGALNQHLFKVTPIDVPAWTVYEAVDHHLPAFQAIASAKAVTMGHIQRHHLDEAMVPIPQAPLLGAMDEIFGPIHDRRLTLSIECRTLTTLRDTLLPRLISGELRIRDVESAIEAA